ncbi:hypothetical protein MBLNU13_g10114t1 [Cladosporium sp. NU13]
MPLWIIYHPTGTFEDNATKEALSRDITAMYTDRGLPAFYVLVNFIKLAGVDVYIGGRPNIHKGYDEEFHVDETERRLWRIQGMDPPTFGSEQERLWAAANKAVALK